eukprot:gnl/MRDRNA2_/MRDRNA2_362941_c0_seq1.p1 gnl/MRDRNA2_/MRDRNA2_362941_c0~~gnl/MRDRNA2_/MRDRNA2_362941_c0_seq1.p1  ORF type:complete len:102 (-),score=10.21 gnl/MRDRNA2_/MRDRNA2_362941_c0_seq1:233-538(-)
MELTSWKFNFSGRQLRMTPAKHRWRERLVVPLCASHTLFYAIAAQFPPSNREATKAARVGAALNTSKDRHLAEAMQLQCPHRLPSHIALPAALLSAPSNPL